MKPAMLMHGVWPLNNSAILLWSQVQKARQSKLNGGRVTQTITQRLIPASVRFHRLRVWNARARSPCVSYQGRASARKSIRLATTSYPSLERSRVAWQRVARSALVISMS
jgi:hypothetical protein